MRELRVGTASYPLAARYGCFGGFSLTLLPMGKKDTDRSRETEALHAYGLGKMPPQPPPTRMLSLPFRLSHPTCCHF